MHRFVYQTTRYARIVATMMAREAWTDERLDDLSTRVDAGFARMDARFDRMEARFDKVDERFERVDERFERVDERFDRLYQLLIQGGVAFGVALIGLLAALIGLIATQL
jgi:hypothetical protein